MLVLGLLFGTLKSVCSWPWDRSAYPGSSRQSLKVSKSRWFYSYKQTSGHHSYALGSVVYHAVYILHQSTVVALNDSRSIFRFFWMVPNLSFLGAGLTSGEANLIPSNTKRCNYFAEEKKKRNVKCL